MQPAIAPLFTQISFALGNLVFMVGKGQVGPAAVDVDGLTQIAVGHGGALNVPAGIAHAPGGVPLEGLVLKFGLGEPEHKVVFVPLVGVLLHALPDAHGQILGIVVVEDIVALQPAGVKYTLPPAR